MGDAFSLPVLYLESRSPDVSERFFFCEHHIPLAGDDFFLFDSSLNGDIVGAIKQGCGKNEYGISGSLLLQKSRSKEKTGLLYLDHRAKK